VRIEKVYPAGVSAEDCRLSHTRPVWRLENGQTMRQHYIALDEVDISDRVMNKIQARNGEKSRGG
jgi:hypothetical protein